MDKKVEIDQEDLLTIVMLLNRKCNDLKPSGYGDVEKAKNKHRVWSELRDRLRADFENSKG